MNTAPPSAEAAPPAPTISLSHIDRFQRRAKVHFRIGILILLLILSLFAASAYIFFFAQEIDRAKSPLEQYQQVLTAIENQKLVIKSLEIEVAGVSQENQVGLRTTLDVLAALALRGDAKTRALVLEEKRRLMREVGYSSDTEDLVTKEELAVQRKGMLEFEEVLAETLKRTNDRFKVGEVTRTDVAQVERYIGQAKVNREIVENKMKTAPEAAKVKKSGASIEIIEVVRTSLVRFGGVAVTLFLIAVLVPIYRYNVRLGSFYLARADTLLLCRDARVDNFGAMIGFLTPTLGFEKQPSTPVESLSSMFKDVGTQAKKA